MHIDLPPVGRSDPGTRPGSAATVAQHLDGALVEGRERDGGTFSYIGAPWKRFGDAARQSVVETF